MRLIPLLLLLTLAACAERPLPATDVHALAERGDTDALLATLADGGNVDPRDVCYRTPLMFAAQFGRIQTVRELIDAGARVNLHEKGNYSALMLAAGNGHTEVVRVLIDAGAAIDDVELTRGWTALIWAAQRGHADTVRLLLARGADPRREDRQGWTARDWAHAGQHAEVFGLL